MQKKMTSGSSFYLLLNFTIPMMGGLLFQQFYNMADTVIVGRYLGVQKLAAVGATGSIHFMIIGFCSGLCDGCGIPVAQQFGPGNPLAWMAADMFLIPVFFRCVKKERSKHKSNR